MANSLTAVVPQLLAQALPVLRANAVLPRLVNRDYEGLAAQKGSTIDVPIVPTMITRAVTPGPTPPADNDITEETVQVSLDTWREAPFHMTDKEQAEVMAGSIPNKAAAAVAKLADYVDETIFTAISQGAGIALGTAGTTPFATLALAKQFNTELNKQRIVKQDRHVVFNADAESNLIALDTFANSDFVGDVVAMTEGGFNANGRRLNANWWQDENTPTHTAGTGTSYQTNLVAGYAVGDTDIAIDTGSGTVVVGDVVTFAGDTNQYVVTSGVTAPGTITIGGAGLKKTLADNVAMTIVTDHVVNVAFQKQSIVLASRQLASSSSNAMIQSVTDPVTGLTLRLEVLRGWKQDMWSFDILFGTKVVEGVGCIKILG